MEAPLLQSLCGHDSEDQQQLEQQNIMIEKAAQIFGGANTDVSLQALNFMDVYDWVHS